MAEFHELHGDYVANAGQSLSLREYLDYFEPVGSALSRLPDGAGGPFVHQFTDRGGRTIGSIGWVVSAGAKRFGGWKLWGLWCESAIPPVALPLMWTELADPANVPELLRRANANEARLFDRKRWVELMDEGPSLRVRDGAMRDALQRELAQAWATPAAQRNPVTVELTPETLDVLPFLYILGPIEPAGAQLLPNRFNAAGYQYILDEKAAASRAVPSAPVDVDALIDTAASDVVAAWRMANELRRPPRPKAAGRRPVEKSEMKPAAPRTPPSPSPSPSPVVSTMTVIDLVYRVLVILLLAWIGWNTRRVPDRVAVEPAATVSETETSAPEPETPRVDRIAAALAAHSLRNITITATALEHPTEEQLARVAVEIFLRRNACYTPRTEVVDGKLSAAELRAARNCPALQSEKLMDTAHALAWLERITTP